MAISIVGHVNFSKEKKKSKETVLNSVERAMKLANYKQHIKGRTVFLKPNLLSFTLVPGQCTSPWVIEGVIRVLQRDNFDIIVGDSNVATRKQLDKAAEVWGAKAVCEKYGLLFVNLSKDSTEVVDVNGEIFKKVKIPKTLLNADSIVTIPVLKMHNVTGMTFALKNQWGCLTTIRQRYHLVANICIPDINKFLKVAFGVGDATVCLEGDGPVTGKPRVVNSIVASADLVAMDSFGCKLMGLDVKEVGHILEAEKRGLGSTNYKIKGDPLPKIKQFAKPVLKQHPVVNFELKLRKLPLLNSLIFETHLFRIPAFFASRYNTVYWYNLYGKKYAEELFKKHELYRKEFVEG